MIFLTKLEFYLFYQIYETDLLILTYKNCQINYIYSRIVDLAFIKNRLHLVNKVLYHNFIKNTQLATATPYEYSLCITRYIKYKCDNIFIKKLLSFIKNIKIFSLNNRIAT